MGTRVFVFGFWLDTDFLLVPPMAFSVIFFFHGIIATRLAVKKQKQKKRKRKWNQKSSWWRRQGANLVGPFQQNPKEKNWTNRMEENFDGNPPRDRRPPFRRGTTESWFSFPFFHLRFVVVDVDVDVVVVVAVERWTFLWRCVAMKPSLLPFLGRAPKHSTGSRVLWAGVLFFSFLFFFTEFYRVFLFFFSPLAAHNVQSRLLRPAFRFFFFDFFVVAVVAGVVAFFLFFPSIHFSRNVDRRRPLNRPLNGGRWWRDFEFYWRRKERMRGSKRKKREKNRSKDVDKSTVGKRFNANRKSKGENRPKKNHNIKKKRETKTSSW